MAGAIIKAREHFFNAKYVGNSQGQKVGQMLPFTDNGTIAKSCIFNRADTAKLDRTPSSAGSRRIFTLSAWLKFGNTSTGGSGTGNFFFNSAISTNEQIYIGLDNNSNLNISTNNSSGAAKMGVTTNRTLEDTSKFYHIVVAFDTTQGTDSNKIKVYIDGTQETSFSSTNYSGGDNYDLPINVDSANLRLGLLGPNSNYYFDGYMAEVNFIDGTAYGPDTFGITDTSTGRWIPKSLGSITYGTNGVRLTFANSAGQTIGDDTSGNGNDLTVTSLVASDIVTDSPTNNIAVMRNYDPAHTQTITNGNLQTATTGTNAGHPVISTLAPSSGKWYAEVRNSGTTGGNTYALGLYILEDMTFWDGSANLYPGGRRDNADGNGAALWLISGGTNYLVTSADGSYILNSNPSYTLGAGDVIGIAADRDNDLVTFYGNNGSAIGSATIPPGRICFTAMSNIALTYDWNFGQNGTFNGNETAGGETDANGEGDFYHSVPTGFKMLKQDNLSATDQNIEDGPTPPIPDLVWVKNRTDGTADEHQLYDSTRGVTKDINLDTAAETTTNDGLQKFVAGGFEIEDDVSVNTADENYISWNWVGGGGTTSANSDGSGASLASTIQANQTAGFSIVQYTGSGSNATVAHGLSEAPEWIMIKNTSHTNSWITSHVGLTSQATYSLTMNNTNAEYSDAGTVFWNNAAPTNKVVSLDTDTGVNGSSRTYIMYCWHSVPGYSKFGKYHGNGNANGPFIYTGFKPAMVMQKSLSSGTAWEIRDNLRGYTPTVGHNGITGNPITQVLYPSNNDHEYTTDNCDFLANGFKWRSSGGNRNDSGKSYVYMAWAVHPFNGDGKNAFATAF